MMLIIGKSTLAEGIVRRFTNCTVVGRPDYDFSQQQDCDRLINTFPKPDVIINTIGTMTDDFWESSIVNYVAPSYLTMRYYDQLEVGHIINVSSTSSWWPSYPDIPRNRFYYGSSKFNLSEFGRQFNRAIVNDTKKITVSTVEPGKFCSKMSSYTGMDIGQVVDLIDQVIKNKTTFASLVK